MKNNDEARRRRTNEIIYRAQAQKTLEDVLFQELVTNFGFEGMKGIARPLIKRVLEIVEEYDANRGLMRPGEVLWLAMDKDRKFGYGLATCLCKMKVVKLQVWTQEEIRRLMKGESHGDVLPDRIARLLKDAYAQGGVLSLVDVGLMVGKSPGCVSEVLRKRYRPRHPEEVLPTIGSVFDVGKTTTHKAIAVKLHLQGLLLTEIARRMDHHPSRVQKYIDDFQRVAELMEQGVAPNRIPYITGLQPSVVKQHMELYEKSKREAEAYPVYESWVECDHATAEGCAIPSKSPSEPDKTST